MGYLITQIVLCLLVAFLLGLALGWLLWGRRETIVADDRPLLDARARIGRLEAELDACRAEAATPAPVAPIASTPAPSATPAPSKPAAAALFGAPADRPIDDLKVISGIGSVIETQLAGIGVTTYRQIANFSADDVERVNQAIEVFQGRIEREDWVAQARRLHRDKYGDDA